MLGNPKWFKRRKYGGWGLTPATWQGWTYITVAFFLLLLTQTITSWMELKPGYQMAILLGFSLLIVADALDMAIKMDKDERETAHEALAERNAAWVMVAVLGVGFIYQAFTSALQGSVLLDPFLVAALLFGWIAKAVTYRYLIDK